MAMRIITIATFAVVVLIVLAFDRQAASEETLAHRDRFFERLIVGGAQGGVIYIEIPLNARYFANTKTPQDRWAVWDAFFSRVLRERADLTRPGRPPYWGDYAYQNVDWSSVASAVDVRVGDVLRVRTPTAEGSAKVVRYAIHYNGPGDANLLLGVAQPIADFKATDTEFLVAAPRLPSCGTRCGAQSRVPDAGILKKIREAVVRGAKIPAGQQIKQIIALEGSFT